MGVLNRNQHSDVLFLMPVRLAGEKSSRGKVHMLCCDAAGKVYAVIIDRAIYELARERADEMERGCISFATLGLEIGPGKFVPAAIEISATEVWALEHILEHALKKGRLPDILKKYLKPIIKLGEAKREAFLSEYKEHNQRVRSAKIPRVLERLPYYSEHDIEFSMPTYKAEQSYPLVVLKRLLSDESTPDNTQRLLILDSDGDLAVIKVPLELICRVGTGLKKQTRKNGGNACMIISAHPQGLVTSYIAITQLQRKALETLTRYFEETGYGKQPISSVAKAVLTRARDSMLSLAQ